MEPCRSCSRCVDGLGGYFGDAAEMRKKLILFVVFLVITAGVAKAALPALALPFIAEAVEAIVVRSAGRQIVAQLGTAAANDTTFAAAVTAIRGTQVAQWLGFGAVAAAWAVNEDTPVAPVLAKQKYAVQVGPLPKDDYKPAKVSPGFEIRIWDYKNAKAYYVYGKTREEAINNWMIKAKSDDRYSTPIGPPTSWNYTDSYWGAKDWANTTLDSWGFTYWSSTNPNPYDTGGSSETVYRSAPVEPRDGERRILFQSGRFIPDNTDPDWSEQEAIDFGQPAAFGFVGKGVNNEPLRVGITATPSEIHIKEDVQGLTPDGKPTVVSRDLQLAPGTGTAVSTSSATQAGQTLETQPANWSPPGTSGDSGTSSSSWPSDYARDATVLKGSQAAEKSAESLKTISEELTKKADSADPEGPDMDQLKNLLTFKDVFKDLLQWQLPPHKSECPIIEFKAEIAFFDLSPRIDAHCKMIDEQLRETMNTAFGVVYLVIAFFILMGA